MKNEISARFDGGEVYVSVTSIRGAARVNVSGVVVYGDMRIASSSRIAKANLDCFYLNAAAKKSSKPYVASVAHVLTQNYAADSDGVVRVPVYWIFKGTKMDDFKASKFEIVVNQSEGKCIINASQPNIQPS